MKDVAKKIFDNYARHYEMGSAGIERLPKDMDRLRRDRVPHCMKQIPKDAHVLDMGCAQGHLLAILQRVGYTHLTGVDVSASLIQQARSLVTQDVTLHVADVQSFLAERADASYDVIFFHDVLEHIPRELTIEVLSEFHRALKPGGILSLRVPNMASLLASYNAHIDFTHVTQFAEFALFQVLEQAGFDATQTWFESQAPVIFWSWTKPHRALFRVLNRLRWHLNNGLHRFIYKLSDVFPMPTVFDFNIILIARK